MPNHIGHNMGRAYFDSNSHPLIQDINTIPDKSNKCVYGLCLQYGSCTTAAYFVEINSLDNVQSRSG